MVPKFHISALYVHVAFRRTSGAGGRGIVKDSGDTMESMDIVMVVKTCQPREG